MSSPLMPDASLTAKLGFLTRSGVCFQRMAKRISRPPQRRAKANRPLSFGSKSKTDEHETVSISSGFGCRLCDTGHGATTAAWCSTSCPSTACCCTASPRFPGTSCCACSNGTGSPRCPTSTAPYSACSATVTYAAITRSTSTASSRSAAWSDGTTYDACAFTTRGIWTASTRGTA